MGKLMLIFKFAKKYWWILAIAVFLAVFGLMRHYKNVADREAARADRWKSNYDQETLQLEKTRDAKGRLESQVRTLEVTKRELQSAKYEKNQRIQKLLDELEYSQVKIEDLEQAIVTELASRNTGETQITDTVFMDAPDTVYKHFSADDGYLDFEARWQDPQAVAWKYEYGETIYYWTEMKPTIYNNKGEKRFFLWRWIWPRKHPVTKIKSENKNSEIDAEKIKVKKD